MVMLDEMKNANLLVGFGVVVVRNVGAARWSCLTSRSSVSGWP